MVWCLIKHRIHLHGMVLGYVQGHLYLYLLFFVMCLFHIMRAVRKVCGLNAMTTSLLKYLAWQAMHFLQCSTHFSKTCCRPFATSFRRIVERAVFLPQNSLFMVGKAQKSHGVRSGPHRLDGCIVRFLVCFLQPKCRIHLHNTDTPLRK
jgi:hypothetical protein